MSKDKILKAPCFKYSEDFFWVNNISLTFQFFREGRGLIGPLVVPDDIFFEERPIDNEVPEVDGLVSLEKKPEDTQQAEQEPAHPEPVDGQPAEELAGEQQTVEVQPGENPPMEQQLMEEQPAAELTGEEQTVEVQPEEHQPMEQRHAQANNEVEMDMGQQQQQVQFK